jgi:chromosome segregation ATPase
MKRFFLFCVLGPMLLYLVSCARGYQEKLDEMGVLQAEVEVLKRDISQLEQVNSLLGEELEDLMSDIDTLQVENNNMHQKIASREEELVFCGEKLKKYEDLDHKIIAIKNGMEPFVSVLRDIGKVLGTFSRDALDSVFGENSIENIIELWDALVEYSNNK